MLFIDISSRYDNVDIIHHSPWKWTIIERKLEQYGLEIDAEYDTIDLMDAMDYSMGELSLGGLSMNEILEELDDGSQKDCDTLYNARALKRSTLQAANRLGVDPMTFLYQDY